MSDPGPRLPTVIERQFEANPVFWRDVYRDPGLAGSIYRRRLAVALTWIDRLGLQRGARALDVGCGAGVLALELARRGLEVTASDASPAMLALVRDALRSQGATVEVAQAEATRLPFDDGRFSLVVGLGLLPWVADPLEALGELVRVLKADGWLLLSADNLQRLNFLVDPRESPVLAPLKRLRDALGQALGRQAASQEVWRHRPAQIDAMLRTAGLAPLWRETVGFGPFTWLGRHLLADHVGLAVHRRLERARASSATLQRTGWHYLVAARRSVR